MRESTYTVPQSNRAVISLNQMMYDRRGESCFFLLSDLQVGLLSLGARHTAPVAQAHMLH